jgi:SAM-dependent methyltransferase
MLADPREAIAHLHGGRVLDVATGRGGFVEILRDGLASYDEIVGADVSAAGAAAFRAALGGDPRIRFVQVDALRLGFPPASFDTVAISNSLHHFAEPAEVLDEMLRVLRPGGTLVIAEMYRDGQARTQLTHVYLHHWWAAVDRADGIVHRPTSRRVELVGLAAGLGLAGLRLSDVRDLSGDPRDPGELEALDRVIDGYLARCDRRARLASRGETLRCRLHQVGIHGATSLVAVGRREQRA